MQRTNTLLVNFRRVIRLYDTMLKPVCQRWGLVPLEATIVSFLLQQPRAGHRRRHRGAAACSRRATCPPRWRA